MRRVQSQRPLRLTLAVLVPLAAAMATAALVRPPGPQVPDLAASSLRNRLTQVGGPFQPLPAVAPWSSAEIALSTLRRYQLQPGLELQVQRAQVWRRANFQLAYLTRPWTQGRGGRGGSTVVRQTCLVGAAGDSVAGTTVAQLTAAVDQQASRPGAIAARLLGLQPNRSWQCLQISLHSDRPLQPEPEVAALWTRLLPALAGL